MKSEEEFELFLQQTLLPEIERRKRKYRELLARREALRLPWTHKAAIWVVGGALALFLLPSFELVLLVVAAPFLSISGACGTSLCPAPMR